MTRLFLVLGLVFCAACSDQKPSEPDSPAGDPFELLDRADEASYSPLRAGLKDLSYRFTTSRRKGVSVEVTWTKDGGVSGRLLVEPDADQDTQNWARTAGDVHVKEAKQLVDLMVGTTNREQYKDDALTLETANRVRIVAKSKRSLERSLLEARITFDKDGLPRRMETKTVTAEITLVPKHKDGPGGKKLVDTVDTHVRAGGEGRNSEMRFEYQEVGGYTFPRKVTVDGPDGEVVQEYLDVKVDQGK